MFYPELFQTPSAAVSILYFCGGYKHGGKVSYLVIQGLIYIVGFFVGVPYNLVALMLMLMLIVNWSF